MMTLAKIAIFVVGLVLAGSAGIQSLRIDRPTNFQAESRPESYQHRATYLDADGRYGIVFGRRMGMGPVENTPGLENISMQLWSAPISDCSNQMFRCVAADKFVIFLPVTPLAPGRAYQYRGLTLRVIDCTGAEPVCTARIMKEHPQPNGTFAIEDRDPLLVYLTASERGILSMGITTEPENPHVASRQARLVGGVGLFGQLRSR